MDYESARIFQDAERAFAQAKTPEDFLRAAAMHQEILDRDQPYTMLYEPQGLVGASKRLRNIEVNALRALVNLDEWWIAPAK